MQVLARNSSLAKILVREGDKAPVWRHESYADIPHGVPDIPIAPLIEDGLDGKVKTMLAYLFERAVLK